MGSPAATAATPLRIAVWQCAPQPLDVDANLRRLERACACAAGEGAAVLVTPEMFITGYAISSEDTRRLAEPADGRIAQRVAAITRRTGVAVAYGFPESASDGAVYNTAQLVDAGTRVGTHRKMHLFGGLDASRFTPGAAPPPVLSLRGRLVTMVICYDVEFPESVRWAALRGAEVCFVPTANMIGYEIVSSVLVRARAYESGVHVAYANYCGRESEVRYAGRSVICGPRHDGLVTMPSEGEGLLVADVSKGADGPPYLVDRRSDLWEPSPRMGSGR